eukprot:13074459-Heterocapsa_arctica.AAC.1
MLIGIICDDIEDLAFFHKNWINQTACMSANRALVEAVSVRCLEWFKTDCPTDEHLVPDNPAVNQA